MLNLRNQSTRRVDVVTNAAVSSGSLTYMNQILGIPISHAANGATVTFIQEGLVSLSYTGQGTIGAGTYLYWDVSAAGLTIYPGAADVEVGQVVGPDPDGVSGKYLVRMNIGFPRAASGNAQSSIAS